MRKGYLAAIIALAAAAAFSPYARTQGNQAPSSPGLTLLDGWGRPVTDVLKPGEKPGPAPRHDISGTWEPSRGPGDGIQANGPRDMPYDGKPEHDPPYTPLGLQTLHSHKALFGYAAVLESLSNDPRNMCDPLGFPRADFYQVRHTQIMQDDRKIAILYEFEKRWRIIWTDGRELPKEIPQTR